MIKKLTLVKLFTLILFFSFTEIAVSQEFLRAEGKKIMKGDQEILLRGMGLGGWMLQEPYMLQASAFANSQHQIRKKIEELIGEENTQMFYDAWLVNHTCKIDIDSMASWGFNSIRLPMHYNLFTLPIEDEPVPGENTWLETGFILTDSLLSWCEANQMYLILDLHAAPGGQGHDLPISDGDTSKPSLWESQANRDKTVALWKKLAERYVDEEWIGGYDLINEPNWELPGGTALRNLYEQITDSIRTIDNHHIIFIEGNWFANDFTGLTPPWDNNMVYSFHKYWNYNKVSDIQWMLNMRNSYNIPIWLGESGENSNVWFTDAIRLLEGQNIGWAWWPLKKIGTVVCPLDVELTNEYQTLLNYWSGQGGQPTVEFAKNALMEMTENLKLENCTYQKDVIDAMFRQIETYETKPFTEHQIPGLIFATDFDLGTNNYAYSDTDVANYWVATGTHTSWNSGDLYRNDGVDIENCSDNTFSNGYDVGWTQAGEWLQYTVNIAETGLYDLQARVASIYVNRKIHFQLDEVDLCPITSFNSTGGWQSWQTITIPNLVLEQGIHKLKTIIDVGDFNFNYINLVMKGATNTIPAKFVSGATDSTGFQVNVTMNKPMNPIHSQAPEGFEVTVNDVKISVDSVKVSEQNPRIVTLWVSPQIQYGDVVKVTCQGTTIMAQDGTTVEDFFLQSVKINLPVRYFIPCKIEAENYTSQHGISTETTSDTGGGLNVGWTDAGDYMDYLVKIDQPGVYPVNYRVASYQQSGKIELQMLGETTQVIHSVVLPVTGGWQTWKTVTQNATLPAGIFTIRIYVKTAGFNLNWFEFAQASGIDDELATDHSPYLISPNPSDGLFTLETKIQNQTTVSIQVFDFLGTSVLNYSRISNLDFPLNFDLSNYKRGIYFLIVNDGQNIFSHKIAVTH